MCAVSMIGDHFTQKFTPREWVIPGGGTFAVKPPPTREEFDALKCEVREMEALLKRAGSRTWWAWIFRRCSRKCR